MRNHLLSLILVLSLVIPVKAQTDFTISGKRCVNSILTFTDRTANNPTSWSWDFGDGDVSTVQNPTHEYNQAGTYTVMLTSTVNGVGVTRSVQLNIFNNPNAGFKVDTVPFTSYARLFTDTSVTTASPLKYRWYFNEGDNSSYTEKQAYYKFPASGIFPVKLMITDDNGCVDSISQNIVVVDRFYVPNVFTPNDDGINDRFIISSNGITRFSIEIFNRWGNRVFRRLGAEQIIWDGYNPEGTLVTPGTYFYVITVDDGTTTYEPLQGFIAIFY